MKTFCLIEPEKVEEMVEGAVARAFARFSGEKPGEKDDRLLTTNEACRMLRVTRQTLHRWKTEGIIPHVRIGSSIRYKESDVMKFIEDK